MPWIEKEGRTVEEAKASAVAEAGLPEDELDVEVIREGAKGLFGLGGEAAVVRVRPKDEARDVRSAFGEDLRPGGGGASTESRAPAGTEAPQAPAPKAEPAKPPPQPPRPQERPPPPPKEEEPVRAEAPPAPEAEEPEEDPRAVAERQEEAVAVGREMVEGVLQRMDLSGEVRTRIEGGTVYVEVYGDDMGILIGRGGATLQALQEIVRAGVRRRVKAHQPVVVDVEAYWERRRSRRRGRGEGGRGDDRDD